MKHFIAGALVAFCSTALLPSASAQSLEQKRDRKLKAPFMSKASWIADYDKAREASRKTGKLIFAYFTRSYSP